MADEVVIDTRLLGREDVAWDADGDGAKFTYTDGAGNDHVVSYVNANHIPILEEMRSKLGNNTNIGDALDYLAGQLNDSGELQADTTIVFTPELSDSDRQGIVDGQIRNLGGHTLTFQFNSSSDIAFYGASLVFSGFYNGVLIVDLNGISILAAGESPVNIFGFERCFCSVLVTNGSITYQDVCGVQVDECPAIAFSDFEFNHEGTSPSIIFNASDGLIAASCVFNAPTFVVNNLLSQGITNIASATASSIVSAHNRSNNAHEGKFLTISGGTQMIADHNTAADAHAGMFMPVSGGAMIDPVISGGTISGATISGGTMRATVVFAATVRGTTISGGTMITPTISGATMSGGTITSAVVSKSDIESCTINNPQIIQGYTDQTNIVNSVISGGSLYGVTIDSTCTFGLEGESGTYDYTSGSTTSQYTGGYQTLPGGIIVQWGKGRTFGGKTGTYTFDLPKNFATSNFIVNISPIGANSQHLETIPNNTSQFIFSNGVDATRELMFIAIGK